MHVKNQDIKEFEAAYQDETREILVLTNDDLSGASRSQGEILWTASSRFLAYVDLHTDEVRKGEGRLEWPLTEDEQKDRNSWMYRFKGETIYRVRAREVIDKTVPEGRVPAYSNRFLVVKVLEEDAYHEALEELLEEYQKPVRISDEVMGEFELNKELKQFVGQIDWLGQKITAYMDVNPDYKASWTRVKKVLRSFWGQQEERDVQIKEFAAEKLVDLANEWQQEDDENSIPITQEEFIKRISVSELIVGPGGNFIVYCDDDDIFWGHVIELKGNTKKGLESAVIAG